MKKTLLITIILIAAVWETNAQNVNIPDANFKACLVGNSSINTNGDSEIQLSEANAYTGAINCQSQNVSNLTGIESFVNIYNLHVPNNQLTSLDISQNTALTVLNFANNQLTSLNVSQNTALAVLNFANNQLTSLNVSQNTSLIILNISNNQLTSLDVSQNTSLQTLNLINNPITSLDVSQNTALIHLSISGNQLTSLDVSQNTSLQNLAVINTPITSLDVSQNTALEILQCNSNNLTALDVSHNPLLVILICLDNDLTTLNMKNLSTSTLTNFSAILNPALTCIEVDDVASANANWTNKDATASYSLDCTLSTNNLDLALDISIYPNPANSQIHINTDVIIDSVHIIDVFGKTILSNLTSNKTIDVTNLSNGIYFLNIKTVRGSVHKKFIKI